MKKIILLVLLFSTILLIACGNENEPNETNSNTIEENGSNEQVSGTDETSSNTITNNLFNSEEIERGEWIGQSGQVIEAEEMIISNPIDYNPNSIYEVNKTCYITYMNGEEILETRLHDGPTPLELASVEEADKIRISFDETKLEGFELTEK